MAQRSLLGICSRALSEASTPGIGVLWAPVGVAWEGTGSLGMRVLTLETLGSCLPQRKENVAHDSGAADTRFSDDGEDAVHILPKVLLRWDRHWDLTSLG